LPSSRSGTVLGLLGPDDEGTTIFPKRGFVNYLSSRQAQHTVRLEVVSSTAVRVSGPEGKKRTSWKNL